MLLLEQSGRCSTVERYVSSGIAFHCGTTKPHQRWRRPCQRTHERRVPQWNANGMRKKAVRSRPVMILCGRRECSRRGDNTGLGRTQRGPVQLCEL